MRQNVYGAALLLSVLCASATYAADVFDGVFASVEEGCTFLEQEGVQAIFEHDFLMMTLADGIDGNEYRCEFVDVKSSRGDTVKVVTAYCEYPGELQPDMFAIREYGENTVSVNSLMDIAVANAVGEGMPPASIYYRCDNVKESLR